MELLSFPSSVFTSAGPKEVQANVTRTKPSLLVFAMLDRTPVVNFACVRSRALSSHELKIQKVKPGNAKTSISFALFYKGIGVLCLNTCLLLFFSLVKNKN